MMSEWQSSANEWKIWVGSCNAAANAQCGESRFFYRSLVELYPMFDVRSFEAKKGVWVRLSKDEHVRVSSMFEKFAKSHTVYGLYRLYYGNIHHSLLANALTALRGAFHALKWRILLFFRIRKLLEGYTHQYYSKLCYTFLRSFTVTYLLCTNVHKTL